MASIDDSHFCSIYLNLLFFLNPMKTVKRATPLLKKRRRWNFFSSDYFYAILFMFLPGLVSIPLALVTSYPGLWADEKTVVVKVKNKYTTTVSESNSHKRIDVEFERSCTSDALIVEDFRNFESGVNNSATLYANLDVNKTYELKIVGTRNPAKGRFHYVSAVIPLDRKIDCPE
ncbi:MAG: hypothetical protein WBB29_22985 [Geitlerinemataceae cyanobacterium]